MFIAQTKKHATIYNVLIMAVLIFVVSILANMFIKQQTYNTASGKPQDGETFTKNVLTNPLKKK